MAKSNSLAKLQGTFGEITFVNSPTYGNHIRSKRGTFKKAEVNAAFKASSKKLATANIAAKIIKDAINDYRDGLEGGPLWRRLISTFRTQLREERKVDFSKMEPFEIHPDYPFNRFLKVPFRATVDRKRSFLKVTIPYNKHPDFSKLKYVDGYRFTVVGIFPDLRKKTACTSAWKSDVMALKGKLNPFQVELRIPPKAKTFLMGVKIEGYTGGETKYGAVTKGMKIFRAGVI